MYRWFTHHRTSRFSNSWITQDFPASLLVQSDKELEILWLPSGSVTCYLQVDFFVIYTWTSTSRWNDDGGPHKVYVLVYEKEPLGFLSIIHNMLLHRTWLRPNLTIVELTLAKKDMNSETFMKNILTNAVFGCLLRCTYDKEKCIHRPRGKNEDHTGHLSLGDKKPFTSSFSSKIAYGWQMKYYY